MIEEKLKIDLDENNEPCIWRDEKDLYFLSNGIKYRLCNCYLTDIHYSFAEKPNKESIIMISNQEKWSD